MKETLIIDSIPKRPLKITEQIALFSIKMEHAIFLEPIPPTEWRKTFGATLSRYPDLLPYSDYFSGVLKELEIGHTELSYVWESHMKKYGGSEAMVTPFLRKADPETSAELFKTFFDQKPVKSSVAYHGAITLRFMVDQEDFLNIDKTNTTDEECAAFAYHPKDYNFSILVLPKDPNDDSLGQNSYTTDILHELEHSKNRLIHQSIGNFLIKRSHASENPEDLKVKFQMNRRLRGLAREAINHYSEFRAKDELLSMLSLTEYLVVEDLLEDKNIKDYLNALGDVLAGTYLKIYEKRRPLGDKEKVRYFDSIYGGINSFTDLFNFYRSSNFSELAGGLTLRILRQAPLHTWSALVHLLTK